MSPIVMFVLGFGSGLSFAAMVAALGETANNEGNETMGFRINLEGLLESAALLLKTSSHSNIHAGGYASELRQLSKNLRELRDRHAAGDTSVVDEFFSLYVFD
ncbi:MAG: hypothetical protein JNG90_05300 [Planctomycetaceae bacterium]|nr:hypothetical protein [Planctomycetaceae bacterium]